MRRYSLVCLFILIIEILIPCLHPIAFSQVPVEPDSAMQYLRILTDPETYAGRKTGIESGTRSQTWIAGKFREWGLQPLLNDDVLAPYEMLVTDELKSQLKIFDTPWGAINFLPGDDYTLNTNSGSGKIRAKVALVGRGINKPEKGWDDYGETDVRGRIVVIFRGEPNSTEDWSEENSRVYLLKEAVRRGAVAVIFHDHGFPIKGSAIFAEAYSPSIPSVYVGERVIRHLLMGSGVSYEAYKRVLSTKPYPLLLDRELLISAKMKRIEPGIGYNVVGIVPGSDPKLAKEAVIIGGHGDHVGPDALGHVYVGADDNASGASTVMELARAFANYPQPRTMIFCIFGGEEQGLLGSKALAPILPDAYTYVNMLNFDMVGKGEGIFGIGGGDMLAEVWNPWWESLPDSVKDDYDANRAWGGESSDHASFRNEGIPAFTCYSKGKHDFYHSLQDLYETIDHAAIAGAVTGAVRWIETIAEYPNPLSESHLAARTLWHQGSPLQWLLASHDLTQDFDIIENHLDEGWMGILLTLPLYPASFDSSLFLLDRINDCISCRTRITLGKSLTDLSENSYRRKATAFLGVTADSFTFADTTAISVWNSLGVHWIILSDPTDWTINETLIEDKAKLLKYVIETMDVVQLPLSQTKSWFPVLEQVENKAILVGSWGDYKTQNESDLEKLNHLHVHLLTHCHLGRA